MKKPQLALCLVALAALLSQGQSVLAAVTVLNPVADAEIDTREPDRVFNDDPWNTLLHADYSYIGPHYRHALLKFDLSSLPSAATIASASLHMYGLATSREHTFLYRAAQDGWSEDTMSWNSYAPYLPSAVQVGDTLVEAYYPNAYWFTWDIDLVLWGPAADQSDGYVTLLLKGDVSDFDYTLGACLASKEYRSVGGEAHLPYLELTWTPEPASALGLLVLAGMAVLRRR
jgi:hypothetical protein